MNKQPRILVAPLDWGLGHATRCIPLIRLLLQRGCYVMVGAEGAVEHLLRTEFPQLHYLPLPGYRVRYAKTGLGLLTALTRQLPRLFKTIKEENAWLHKIVAQHRIDAVISDNRYGLHHQGIYSVLITHQLQVQTPLGKIGHQLLQILHYKYINRFNACWVPDYEAAPGLAGALSHPAKMPAVPLTYLGPLSRFEQGEEQLQHYVLVMLSGPEPQRTVLEQQLLPQLKAYGGPVLFVRGLPGTIGLPPVPYNVNIMNHLGAGAMQQALQGAQLVIARTGYSTVMELMALQKKSILIPTPGQTEQQYLARHLMKHHYALCLPQKGFSLLGAVQQAQGFAYAFPEADGNSNSLANAVDALLQKISNHENAQVVKSV